MGPGYYFLVAELKLKYNQPLHSNERNKPDLDYSEVSQYYNNIYHRSGLLQREVSPHLRRLARRLGPLEGKQLLDVGCGTGQWLMAAAQCDAIPFGIDISQVAIDACRQVLSHAELHCGSAESLSFKDKRFDVISCLGSLEHFLDSKCALKEMVRVAKPTATFLFCVPNANFLTCRVGLYCGTQQAEIREEVRTLAAWEELFNSAGLSVTSRWRDLHVLSWSWIGQGNWYLRPIRAAQALVLPLWPISWQYQVYHLCKIR